MSRCIMVQGTMSGAGKSLLCAALCRILRQDGYRVAPFKSQNMALNSGVTRDALEMGRAQIVQAEAAGVEPDVRMNPILLKPSSDTGSQVIVNGIARAQMSAQEYFACKTQLIPEVLAAYRSLADEYDVIVIEGAGSCAEINLRSGDIVNMGLAELVDAPVLLTGDIDRGGVFAQLYGTVALLPPEERARIRGLVINKFRGDVGLLTPGLRRIEALTGKPVLGVVPYLRVDVDDEDSLAPRLDSRRGGGAVDVAVLRLPHMSNFTDFAPLESHPQLRVRYVERAHVLGTPDLVLLPGTKSTTADLLWLRQNGLETLVQRLASAGTPVLGICGGYQMLGETLLDPDGTEGALPRLRGMGLLPCVTTFEAHKTLTRVRATVANGALSGTTFEGYEIHTGVTQVRGAAFCRLEDGRAEGCCAGSVWGTYLHGLFDSGEMTDRLTAWLCARKGIAVDAEPTEDRQVYRQRQYDLLADGVRAALDMDAVYRILEGA
ncbi:MAG: cobyric acid synthase [Oscillospiraceae bacterium]|nr:cobyric acid synthase [Oscillospiraceae bacterium]